MVGIGELGLTVQNGPIGCYRVQTHNKVILLYRCEINRGRECVPVA
jgi:hypothetical protein